MKWNRLKMNSFHWFVCLDVTFRQHCTIVERMYWRIRSANRNEYMSVSVFQQTLHQQSIKPNHHNADENKTVGHIFVFDHLCNTWKLLFSVLLSVSPVCPDSMLRPFVVLLPSLAHCVWVKMSWWESVMVWSYITATPTS